MSSNNYIKDDFSPIVDDSEEIANDDAAPTDDAAEEYDDVSEEETSSDDPEDKSRRQIPRVLKRVGAWVAVAVIVIFAAMCAVAATLPQDVVYEGITCAGIDLGNMTYDQALTALSREMSVNIPNISVNVNGNLYNISQDEIELSPLVEETAKKVYTFGKSENKIENAYSAVRLKFHKIDILPVTTVNEDKLKEKLIEIGNAELGEMKPFAAAAVDMTHARLIPGTRGYDLDTEVAIEEFKAAVAADNYTNIPLTMNSANPQPLTVEQVEQSVNLPAEDAKYTLENGNISIVPEKNGRYINRDECAALLGTVKIGGDPVDLPCYPSAPQITAAMLKEKLFNCVLGSYTTHYTAGGNRGSNVANAANRINGTIILAGDNFSFNKTVGKRSEKNGFKSAPEYVNGETVTGIGGGTCQVSTTLYSAVLYSDLQIVARRNHSMSVGYVPLGQDATVSDGGIDFKFRNDTDYPIKIVAAASGGAITVKILGTEPDVKKTVKITHANVPSSSGKSVKTTRTVYDDAGNVLKTDNIGISRYKPHG